MPSLCVIVVCRGFLLCLNWNVAAVYRSTTMRKTSFFKLIDEVRELPTGTLMYFGNNTLYSTTHISPYQSYWCLRNQRVTATLIFIGILSSITVSLFSISFSSSWQMNSNVDLDILKLVIQSWSINVPLTILSHYSVLLSLSHSILDGVRSWLTKLHRVNAKKTISAEFVAVEMLIYASVLFCSHSLPNHFLSLEYSPLQPSSLHIHRTPL